MCKQCCLSVKVSVMVLSALWGQWAAAGEVKTLTEIEKALNPLAVIANHGGIRRSIDLNIQFALDSAEILPAASRQIDALGRALKGEALAGCALTLTGHTDATGDAGNNLKLSLARAEAVKSVLVNQYGVKSEELTTLGKGESERLPKLAANDARHRRVTVALTDPESCKAKKAKASKPLPRDKQGNVKINW